MVQLIRICYDFNETEDDFFLFFDQPDSGYIGPQKLTGGIKAKFQPGLKRQNFVENKILVLGTEISPSYKL